MTAAPLADDVTIREARASDARFIINSWVESYRKHGCINGHEFDMADKGIGQGAVITRAHCSLISRAVSHQKPSSAANHIYTPEQHALVERILARAAVLIACNADDPDQILGYFVFEPARSNSATEIRPRPVFHYLYVKTMFRLMGIGKRLVAYAASDALQGWPEDAWATHWSPLLAALFKPIAVEYNEYMR